MGKVASIPARPEPRLRHRETANFIFLQQLLKKGDGHGKAGRSLVALEHSVTEASETPAGRRLHLFYIPKRSGEVWCHGRVSNPRTLPSFNLPGEEMETIYLK